MQISITLSGTADHVCNQLTEQPSEQPETDIRKALADYIADNAEPEDTVSLSVSITANY